MNMQCNITRVRQWLNIKPVIQLLTIVLIGFTSTLVAAPKEPPSDPAKITIFPEGYKLPPDGTSNRNECIRDSTDLNSLTCTANDVQLAEITVPVGEPTTCYAGEIVTQKLNFRVKSTAQTRYNWSFYTTTDPEATPLDGPAPNVTNRDA
ncbi:MAG: hypothetical protein ACOYY5_10370, partial [Pseudomonadota bacterium]